MPPQLVESLERTVAHRRGLGTRAWSGEHGDATRRSR
jgi:hypothetical protein